jgi:methyl-accepting chemotaxis protein
MEIKIYLNFKKLKSSPSPLDRVTIEEQFDQETGMKISDLSIGRRMSFGFTIILAILVLNTGLGIYRLQGVAESTREMMAQPLAKERLISDWYRMVYAGIRRTTAIAKSADPSLATFFAEEAKTATAYSQGLIKKIEELSSEGDKQLMAELVATRKIYVDSRDGLMKAKAAGDAAEATRLLEQVYLPSSKVYEGMLQRILDHQRKEIDAAAEKIEQVAESSRNQLALLAVLVIAFGVSFAWWLTTGITRPINEAVALAESWPAATWSTTATAAQRLQQGRTGQAAACAQPHVVQPGAHRRRCAQRHGHHRHRLVANRRRQPGPVVAHRGAGQLAGRNRVLDGGADQHRQAERRERAPGQPAGGQRGRGGAARRRRGVGRGADHGLDRRVVEEDRRHHRRDRRHRLPDQYPGAERGGGSGARRRAGARLAVVASEVRNLAQRSASAAKEIKQLIDDSVGKVEAGTRLVGQAGSTMDEVVASIRRVTAIVGEISNASVEQTHGIEQINLAITQMDQVTQQNAALVEQAAAAAGSMQEQAGKLAEAVSIFKLEEPRRSGPHRARRGDDAVAQQVTCNMHFVENRLRIHGLHFLTRARHCAATVKLRGAAPAAFGD